MQFENVHISEPSAKGSTFFGTVEKSGCVCSSTVGAPRQESMSSACTVAQPMSATQRAGTESRAPLPMATASGPNACGLTVRDSARPFRWAPLSLTTLRVVVFCTRVPVGPNTAQNLRATADAAEAEGYALLAAGDKQAALAAFQKAQDCRFFAERLEAVQPPAPPARQRRRLPGEGAGPIIDNQPMFTAEHRANMSKARAPRGPSAKLAALAWKHDPPLSLAGLAKKAGISPSLITKAASGKAPMPTAAAEKIQRLTGYPTTAWPRLS
jgi:hypothetical protein